ncbi:MAG: tetratricopeptide repeat protein [Candidatus Azobacteroides sp.]|nr:tetratricopeptide repeat protein [Candidatus Azobacteroides sp.]
MILKKIFTLLLFIVIGVFAQISAQINTDRVMAIGRNALYFEDYILSIQYFNQVIKAKPYLAEPYLYRAIAKFNLDDYKGAEDDITLCLERNPFLVYAYQCRGAARQSLQDYSGAISDYTKGLEFNPEDKQMLLNKGIAYAQTKEYNNAVLVIDTLLKYHPKFTDGYLTRGAVLAEKGDSINALSDFNAAAKLDKYYAPVYGRRGLLYFQMDSLKNALADFSEAIRLDPRQVGYYINRGLVRYHLNNLRGTMADYDIVINLEPDNVIAHFNRGLLRAQVGDNNRSIEDFDVVIKQEPDNYSAIYNRALLREETGDYRGAISDFNLVLTEYPNFVPGYYARSSVKKQMRDIKGADQDYWLAYELEQKLKKEKDQGKIITGKGTIDPDEDSANDTKTREKSDKNIEKFNRLIVSDKTEEEATKYKNEIRGRVQDKNVKVDLSPQFVITFYEKMETFKRPTFADKMLSDYNRKMGLTLQLQITNNEAPLNDAQAEYHFESINNYSLKLNEHPADANIYFGRGMDFMVLQNLTEAMGDFDKAIDLDPSFAIAYFNRAVIRYRQLEINNYNDEDNEKLNMSLNIQTGNKNLSTIQGQFAKSNEPVSPQAEKDNRAYQYELMLRDYDSVIQLDPDFVYAYFNKGNIYCTKKDFRAAILEYNKAINRDPEFAEAYFNRGLTCLYLGDTEKGVADLSKAGELGIVEAYSIIKRMTAD